MPPIRRAKSCDLRQSRQRLCLLSARCAEQVLSTVTPPNAKKAAIRRPCVGRSDRIRTCDILLPKQARYRTALHPEILSFIVFAIACGAPCCRFRIARRLRCTLVLCDGGHSLSLAVSAHGGARERPQSALHPEVYCYIIAKHGKVCQGRQGIFCKGQRGQGKEIDTPCRMCYNKRRK